MATEEQTTTILSAAERERFERDGYLVIDPEIPEEILEGVLRDMEQRYVYSGETHIDDLGVVYGTGARPRVMEAWKISESVRRIALNPKILGVCEELYGRKPLPFQTLNFPVGTQQLPHADAMHFNSDPPGYMCGVWVALEDMDMDNGTLLYFPGSHKLPLPTWNDIGKPPEEGAYPHLGDYTQWLNRRYAAYDAYVQEAIERHGLEPDYAIIPKGSALVWSANLIHGGSPQHDKSRTRHSQVTHYYFEGYRWHTPMRSDGSRRFWRYPWWIREVDVTDERQAIKDSADQRIPENVTVLVMGEAELDLGNRHVRNLQVLEDAKDPLASAGESSAVRELESARAEGAEFLLVPRHELERLTSACNNLQMHLETNYSANWRDGATCAIYRL